MRPITIQAALNGYVMTIGGQIVVFKSQKELLGALGAYLADPDETERRFLRDSINAGKFGKSDAPDSPLTTPQAPKFIGAELQSDPRARLRQEHPAIRADGETLRGETSLGYTR